MEVVLGVRKVRLDGREKCGAVAQKVRLEVREKCVTLLQKHSI